MDMEPFPWPRGPTPPPNPTEPQADPPSPAFNPPPASSGPQPDVSTNIAGQPCAQQPLNIPTSTPDINVHLPLSTEDLARLPHQGFPTAPGPPYDPTSQMSHPIVGSAQDYGAGSAPMQQPMAYGGPMAQLEPAAMAGSSVGHAQPLPQYLDMDGMLPDYLFVNDMMSTWLGGQQPGLQ